MQWHNWPRWWCGWMALVYAGLGTWCLLDPHGTARAVGFELQGASGLSEYLAVYGGLEWGMGLWFACGALKARYTGAVLLSLLCLHAPILLVRQISGWFLEDLGTTTQVLALAEVAILLISGIAWWSWAGKKASPDPAQP